MIAIPSLHHSDDDRGENDFAFFGDALPWRMAPRCWLLAATVSLACVTRASRRAPRNNSARVFVNVREPCLGRVCRARGLQWFDSRVEEQSRVKRRMTPAIMTLSCLDRARLAHNNQQSKRLVARLFSRRIFHLGQAQPCYIMLPTHGSAHPPFIYPLPFCLCPENEI